MAMSETTDLSYEQAREELIEVVRTLESGGGTLEESLALWERGEQLATTARAGSTAPAKRLDAAIGQDAAADE